MKQIIAILMLLLFGGVTAHAEDALEAQINQGKVFYQKGDFEHAALAWEKSLKSIDSKQYPDIYTDTSIHLSKAYQSLGYHQRGLYTFQAALPVVEKLDDPARKAMFFSTLGDLYLSMSKPAEATKHLEKGLEQAYKAENPVLLATVLNNVGNAFAALDNYEEAAGAYVQCLGVIENITETPDKESDKEPDSDETSTPILFDIKSKVLINVARVTFLSKKYEDTGSALDYALTEITQTPDSWNKAANLIDLCALIREIRNKLNPTDPDLLRISYAALDNARNIGTALKDLRILSNTYGYMGELYEAETRYSEAFALTRKAIFYAQQGQLRDILYIWQWQLARLFQAENHTKDAIDAYQDAIATLNPIRRELFTGYRSRRDVFNESVKPVYIGFAGLLLDQADTASEDALRKARLKDARDVTERLKTAELQNFFQDECVTALKKKRRTLDRTPPHTALLYPVITPEKLVLLLTLPDCMKQVSVDVDSRLLRETVRRFRRHLQTRPNNRFLYDAWQLYDWLIRPIEMELTNREIDTLIVAPDGVLRLIPFSTLHDGCSFLVETYAVGTVPAISLTDLKPMDHKNIDILLSGLSESVQDFPPLPGVTAELQDIKKIMNGSKVLFLNKEHTVENLTREFKKKNYDIVHFATHGVFGGTSEESFLLTYDSQLTMDQLEQLIRIGRFREQQVELLTLSACQTALGNEQAALGLAGVAVKAGVRSAIATLWYVDDEATSLAIREFYRQLKKPDISKAKALQNAQKSLISQKRYWHPAYWAPFLLIGNWL